MRGRCVDLELEGSMAGGLGEQLRSQQAHWVLAVKQVGEVAGVMDSKRNG